MWIFLILVYGFHSSTVSSLDFQTLCQAGIRQDNTNYIHCARKQLKEIPNFLRITNTFYDELVLNDNQIVEIPVNAFQGLRVKRLHLVGNQIRSISPGAFRELANYLEELTIEFDRQSISEIPEAIQKNLLNLRRLTLINLRLFKLENRFLKGFRRLEHLAIIKSNLNEIESNAFENLNYLRSLNFDENFLNDSSWFSSMRELNDLETLILSHNRIQTIRKDSLRWLKNLKILDLSSNGLQTIDAHSFPSSLEKLHLQNNELNSLQLTFLFQLKNLQDFNLDFNRLTFVPEKIFQFNINLHHLSLQGNDLNSITNHSFFALKQLINLNLARNRLQFRSNEQPFQHLSSLKILNLDRNGQMNLTSTTLIGLTSTLQEFSLQNCQLTSIDNVLGSFQHLQRLKLSSNQIESISLSTLFHTRTSLISIDLQRNRFSSIPQLFPNDSSLIDLDLNANQIRNIDEIDLLRYPHLKTIGLSGNPLNCDCHLRWIKRWLKEKYEAELIQFLQWTCQTPDRLLGKQLSLVDQEEMICEETTAESIPRSIASVATSLVFKTFDLDSNGKLNVSWESVGIRYPKYYQFHIYDNTHQHLLVQRPVFSHQRSIEVQMIDYLQRFSSTYLICLKIRRDKYCRPIHLNWEKKPISAEIHLYVLGASLLFGILICCLLIYLCYWRLTTTSKEQFSHIETIDCDEKNSCKPFYYHSLHIHGYPSSTSNHTSECSLHSSTDQTASVLTDPYHVYQQIPSLHPCRIHSTRIPVHI